MAKKKPKQGTLTRRADRYFSLYIRQRDGQCQAGRSWNQGCEGIHNLQCAHGLSRRYYSTRWDPRNAWALCRACHTYFTHHPIEWDMWLEDRLGLELYREIRLLALTKYEGDKEATAALYRSLVEEAA